MKPTEDIDFQLMALALVMGAVIGIGQLLSSEALLSPRVIIGRALVAAGLAACAPIAFLWFPAMPKSAEFAIAALFASLGTSGLQSVLRRFTGNSGESK